MSNQSKYISKLQGTKVLIVGGSSGIGFGVAEASLEHGAAVIISSSNQSRLDNAIQRLKASYPANASQVSGQVVDVGNPETVEANLTKLLSQVGKVDHIAWTAGEPLDLRPLSAVDVQYAMKSGNLRLIAPIILGKLAPQFMNPGPQSSITFTTGIVSEKPAPYWTVVNSYASALQGLTRALALELRPIRVNAVSPGATATELFSSFPQEQQTAMVEAIAKASAVGAVGSVEDVAEAYIYLMKDKNVTGSQISSNGGALIMGS